jgi:hypothetical protein
MSEIKIKSWAEEKFNDPNRIPVGKLQQNLYEIIREVQKTQKRKLITRTGKVVAILSPLEEVATFDQLINDIGENII